MGGALPAKRLGQLSAAVVTAAVVSRRDAGRRGRAAVVVADPLATAARGCGRAPRVGARLFAATVDGVPAWVDRVRGRTGLHAGAEKTKPVKVAEQRHSHVGSDRHDEGDEAE